MKVIRKWMVMAPDRAVLSIDGPAGMGQVQLAHGSFIYNESLAKYMPQFFIPIEEDLEPEDGATMLLSESKATTKPDEKPTTKPDDKPKKTKSGGRKKGTPNKPKK